MQLSLTIIYTNLKCMQEMKEDELLIIASPWTPHSHFLKQADFFHFQ